MAFTAWAFTLGGTTLPNPQDFQVQTTLITRNSRAASGKLLMDVIASKRKFTLTWHYLAHADTANLVSLFNQEAFLTFVWTDSGGQNTATVWFNDLPRKAQIMPDEYWDISITLEEQ